MNDSGLNLSNIFSEQGSIRNMKRKKNDLDESQLNLSSEQNEISSRKYTKDDQNNSKLSGFSQSTISAKGHMNDTQVSAGLQSFMEHYPDGNDSSVLEQVSVQDANWLLQSKKITEKLEQKLYEAKQNQYRILDNNEIHLQTDHFIKPNHEVRAYKNEIFQNSVDKNSVIVMETDSAKLTITMMHIFHRLKNNKNKKVVFLCPLIASVEHQATLIKAMIGRLESQTEYSTLLMELQPTVLILHGGKGDDGWKLLSKIQKPIIITTTPQYLLNGFRRSYIKFEELSFLAFDECHHCLKSHPYNMIMQEFYNNLEEKPQILGIISSGAPMTFGFKKEDVRTKLIEVCRNLNAEFCTLHENVETKLDAWTFANDAELDALDILELADQRKLTAKFDKIGFLEEWNNTLNKLFGTMRWKTKKEKMLAEDYYRSKILNKAIALSLELGYYAVYLYFTEICEEEFQDSGEIFSEFFKSIESYNEKGKISGKCKLLIENLSKLVLGGRKGIVFVEKKYMGRILNKIINHSGLNSEKLKSYFGRAAVEVDKEYNNIVISTNLKKEEIEALGVQFAVSFHEPKTSLSILQIRSSLPQHDSPYYLLLSKNIAENRLKGYEFGLSLQNIVKGKALPSPVIAKDSPQEMSTSCPGLNTNWADWLSKIFCKSLPPNSIDVNKSFYMMIQQVIHGKPQFTCIMLLPSQCNVRIVLGGTYPIKNDAKRSAALKCCEKFHELGQFDQHLNPDSLNKSFAEFASLQTEPFECQEDSEELANHVAEKTPELHHISHFAKPFELEASGKFYKGFLYEIVFLNPNTDDSDLRIGFLHSSQNLDKFSPLDSNFMFKKLKKEIRFTVEQYRDYLLVHRYLAAMIESKPGPLLQFFNILTQDPPDFYKFEAKELDPDYEFWISDFPRLSFFVVMDDDNKIDEDFLRQMKNYIEYQCRVYQYINSISLDAVGYQPLWDFPKRQDFICPKDNEDKLGKYIIQDIWKFQKHIFKEIRRDLQEIDHHEVQDRRSQNLQMREILYIDPFLRNLEDKEEDCGFEVEVMDENKKDKMIYFEDELMLSPVSMELFEHLKKGFEKLKVIKQEELSWRLYEKILKPPEKEKIQKEKVYSIETGDVLDVFDFFNDQFEEYVSFGHLNAQNSENLLLNQTFFDRLPDFDEIKGLGEKLKDLFVLESYDEKSENNYYVLLGQKLIEMLMHIDIFSSHLEAWDYSLEKIKRERMKEFNKKKKDNDFLKETQELFVSSTGNMLFSNPIITRGDLEPFRFAAEYVAQSNIEKVVKNTALYLKKENDLSQVQKFLHKIGLLENENVIITPEKSDGARSSALDKLYIKFRKLEETIGYTFSNKRLSIQAVMEISLRDHYVEWTAKVATLFQKTSLFELKERVFQNSGEEFSIELPPMSIEEIFPSHVPEAINFFHSKVNEMDRLRWLGEGLVHFYTTEWVYDSVDLWLREFGPKMDIGIYIKARYLTEERFITAVSWEYELENYLLAHQNCFNQLKILKQKLPRKELFTKSLEEPGTERLCYISASLFYSLIGAIFLDSQRDVAKVKDVILDLMTPVAKKHFKREFILEYAVYKLEEHCKSQGLEKPVIKKFAVDEKESFTMPASSKYVLSIGEEEYSSLISTSLKRVEYALYVLACEKLSL